MVGTPAGPGFVVFGRYPVRIRCQAFSNLKIVNKPVAAIRILHGIKDDNRVAHYSGNPGVTA